MNENHARLCASPEWAKAIEGVLSSLVTGADLGDEMLEIGPGPGAATEWLRHRVRRLTSLDLDATSSAKLAARFAGTNVEVLVGDASRLSFDDASFDSVGCFTMLHHIPTAALQYQVLREMWRVLRPGGVLIGSDSVASNELHHFHIDDTYNPIEPSTLLVLLRTLGFVKIAVSVGDRLGFVAHKAE
jgi:ubiquinone/menaquinone biosynthesis C-methylase UbiE